MIRFIIHTFDHKSLVINFFNEFSLLSSIQLTALLEATYFGAIFRDSHSYDNKLIQNNLTPQIWHWNLPNFYSDFCRFWCHICAIFLSVTHQVIHFSSVCLSRATYRAIFVPYSKKRKNIALKISHSISWQNQYKGPYGTTPQIPFLCLAISQPILGLISK